MPTAAVLIGSPALGELAQRWVAAGLMGPVIHLDRATVAAPMDISSWQSAEGTLCSADGASPVRVQETLASEGALRGITAVWVRDDTEDVAAGMHSVGTFARRIIHQGTSPRLFDLIAPTRADGVDVTRHTQGWQQLVVVPEDRPELASPDAGWLDRRDAVLLHVAAAALGRLGGVSEPLPTGSTADPRAVSVWSRHGLGGETLRREAVAFLDRRLPGFCAPDIKPRQYAVFAEQWDHAETIVDWLRQRHDGQLSYTRASPAPPNLDPYADAASPTSVPVAGRRAKMDEGEPLGPAEREALWCRSADQELHKIRKSAGKIPPSALWRDTVQLLTTSVDGGELPEGFTRYEAHDHLLVVQPHVAGPDRELLLEDYPEHEEEIPELASSPPKQLAGEALATTAQELWDGAGSAVAFPVLRGKPPRHHGALLDELTDGDREEQKAQRERLLAVGLDGTPAQRSVADSLWTTIMADAIRSRLDAERWHKAAVADWPVRGRKVTPLSLAGWILCGLATAFAAGWLLSGDAMNELVGNLGLGPWDPAVLGLSSLGVAIGSAAAAFLLRPRRMDDGYWHWRMALRLVLKQRAEGAYDSTRRLSNSLQIYTQWWQVLRDIFPYHEEEDDKGHRGELIVPRALQHGHVEVHEPYRDLVLSQAGVEPGWRWEALAQLAPLAYAKYGDESHEDALDAAFEDYGYSEGALHRLRRDLPGAWKELRACWIHRAVLKAKDGLVGPASRIGGEHSPQLLSSFLDEVREGTAPVSWPALEGMVQGPETTIAASTQPGDATTASITPTAPALASAMLVVLRPLRASHASGDPGGGGDPGSGELPPAEEEDDEDDDDPY
ncbi:MAG TPA: hypothetical protein PKE40_00685 [Arachnia sp.]|nr:hypothetical protein [Arachnia sp.]HMT84842.1 hypothetical protein [Arachnia sp.]